MFSGKDCARGHKLQEPYTKAEAHNCNCALHLRQCSISNQFSSSVLFCLPAEKHPTLPVLSVFDSQGNVSGKTASVRATQKCSILIRGSARNQLDSFMVAKVWSSRLLTALLPAPPLFCAVECKLASHTVKFDLRPHPWWDSHDQHPVPVSNVSNDGCGPFTSSEEAAMHTCETCGFDSTLNFVCHFPGKRKAEHLRISRAGT